jgi:hypothetical protein
MDPQGFLIVGPHPRPLPKIGEGSKRKLETRDVRHIVANISRLQTSCFLPFLEGRGRGWATFGKLCIDPAREKLADRFETA